MMLANLLLSLPLAAGATVGGPEVEWTAPANGTYLTVCRGAQTGQLLPRGALGAAARAGSGRVRRGPTAGQG